MSKHRNATLTPFHTVPMPSQKCQRFRFEHPFTSMVTGITGSGKTAWVDRHYNKLQKPFTFPHFSSRERQPQHKFKQWLFEAVQESSRQIANFDSRQANVSRANWFLFKPVRRGFEKTLWLPTNWSENYIPSKIIFDNKQRSYPVRKALTKHAF